MIRRLVMWCVGAAALGGLLGVAVGKGDPRAPAFLAGLGIALGALGSLVANLFRNTRAGQISGSNRYVITGLVIGMAAGAAGGGASSLGKMMIAVLNPTLPLQDFQLAFGVIGGSLLGAALGTVLGALVQRSPRGLSRRSQLTHKER